jgi:hypothetical protein
MLVFSDALVFARLRNFGSGKLQRQEVERVTACAASGEMSSQDAGAMLRGAEVLPIKDVAHAVLTRRFSAQFSWDFSKVWFELSDGSRTRPTWIVQRKPRQSLQQLLHAALGERFRGPLGQDNLSRIASAVSAG